MKHSSQAVARMTHSTRHSPLFRATIEGTACPVTSSASTWAQPTARWPIRDRRAAVDGSQPGPIETLPIPQVVGRQRRVRAAAPAVVPLPARRPRSFPRARSTCPGNRLRTAWSALSRASTGPRCPAGWSARPRAGSRTPASTAGARSCPGPPPRTWPGSRPSRPRRPTSSTSATPGTPGSPARQPPTGSKTRRFFLTVPASFDAVARELTMEAAGKAGLKQVTCSRSPRPPSTPGSPCRARSGGSRSRSATSSWSATSAAARPTSP